jgi:hypothetical protein
MHQNTSIWYTYKDNWLLSYVELTIYIWTGFNAIIQFDSFVDSYLKHTTTSMHTSKQIKRGETRLSIGPVSQLQRKCSRSVISTRERLLSNATRRGDVRRRVFGAWWCSFPAGSKCLSLSLLSPPVSHDRVPLLTCCPAAAIVTLILRVKVMAGSYNSTEEKIYPVKKV